MTHGGHASLSAAGSSASALGPSSVRSTGVDVPVGAWKRNRTIKQLPCVHRNPWTYVHISYIREYSSPNLLALFY